MYTPFFSVSDAKKIDLVNYLETLGFKPDKIRNNDYWYASPLRDEKTPSFKVNRKLNLWYDHGIGKGGTIIDFGIFYHRCSVAEFLQRLQSGFSFHQPVSKINSVAQIEPSPIKIIDVTPITSVRLRNYLEQRCIHSI
jgi:DNA primase